MAWRRWVLPSPRVPVDEKGVVGAPGRLRHGLGGRMGQTVRGGRHEGLEGEFRIQLDRRRLPAHAGDLDRLRASRGFGFGGQDRDLLGCGFGRHGAALLDLEASPDRGPHLVGQGVLDHGEVARLHPFADEPVGHRQDEHAVGVAHGLDAREPELPRALRDLVAQRPGAPCPKISSLRHWYGRTPLLPPRRPASCSERSSVRVIRRTYTVTDGATRADPQIAPNMGGLAAAGRARLEGRGMNPATTGSGCRPTSRKAELK